MNLHYMTCIFVLNKTKAEIFIIAIPALQNSKYLLIGNKNYGFLHCSAAFSGSLSFYSPELCKKSQFYTVKT